MPWMIVGRANIEALRAAEPERATTELQHALEALETAAWSRRWRDVQVTRQRIKELTSVEIKGRLRRELDEERARLEEAATPGAGRDA
jgi:hypothetical protein